MNSDEIKIEKVGTTSVIFVKGVKGDGTMENPGRDVTQFYTPSGIFVGEILSTDCNHIDCAVCNFFCKNQMTQG